MPLYFFPQPQIMMSNLNPKKIIELGGIVYNIKANTYFGFLFFSIDDKF
jgi:hypothetical protein